MDIEISFKKLRPSGLSFFYAKNCIENTIKYFNTITKDIPIILITTQKEIKENPNTKLKEENKSVDGSDINVGTNETEKEISEEQPKEESEDNIGENTQEDTGENGEDNEGEDEELEALKERAKELGITVTHNMKKETIIKKIEEKEPESGEDQNPKGE